MANHDFGGILGRWRKAAGLKQQAFGDLPGVTQATASRWEAGTGQPSPHIYKHLKEFIGHGRLAAKPPEQRLISRQIGIRSLVGLDGMKLL